MTSTAMNAQHLGIMTEIASQMTDEQWNAFVATEKTRRASASILNEQDRVRFVASTRPRKIALATGRIISRKVTSGVFKYTVKLDHPHGMGQIYVRVERGHIEAIAADAPIVYPSAR